MYQNITYLMSYIIYIYKVKVGSNQVNKIYTIYSHFVTER